LSELRAARAAPRLGLRAVLERSLPLGAWLLASTVLVAACTREHALTPYLAPCEVGATCALALRLTGTRLRSLADGLAPRSLEAAGAAAVGVALVAALAGLPAVLRSAYDGLQTPAHGLAQADLDPLGSEVSTAALAAAARVIPAGDSFSVVYGDQYPVPLVFQFWLMPERTFSWGLTGVQWVIVYNEPVPRGLRVRKTVRLAADVYALEVAR